MWLLPGNRKLIGWMNRRPVLGSLTGAVLWSAWMQLLPLLLPRYNWKLALTIGAAVLPLVFLGLYVGVRKGWIH